MNYNTRVKIFEYASYVLILAATVYCFIPSHSAFLTMALLLVSVVMRLLMERTRRKAFEEENDELKADLRRLTALLEKKSNHSTSITNNQ